MATTEQGSPAGADGSRTAGTIDVRRPTDGHAIGRVPVDAATGVAEVARRLRAAQRQWDGEGFAHRRRWLFAWRDWLFDNQRRLADLLQEETGKVRAEADYEVPTVGAVINYYGSRGRRFIADERPRASFPLMKTKRLRVVHRPYEVVGVIGPWNLPALLTFIDVVPALAAGCAVVVKPSELTPLTVTEMTRGWRDDVGAPDVLAVVNGFADTGAAVVDSCDFVQFTGSASTGRVVARRAAEQLTPCSLELSGKDPIGDRQPERAGRNAEVLPDAGDRLVPRPARQGGTVVVPVLAAAPADGGTRLSVPREPPLAASPRPLRTAGAVSWRRGTRGARGRCARARPPGGSGRRRPAASPWRAERSRATTARSTPG
jgi:Aldehyde dehydrogenase family